MKLSTFKYLLFSLLCLFLFACKKKHEETAVEDVYVPKVPSEIKEIRDTTWVGVLGEETGMSSLQLVTQHGDTVYVSKTGVDDTEGLMLGEVRGYDDKVMVTAQFKEKDEYFLVSYLNISQMEGEWKSDSKKLNLLSDQNLISKEMPYTKWQLHNGLLLLFSEQKLESGVTQITDTATIQSLDADSMYLTIPRYGQLKFGR